MKRIVLSLALLPLLTLGLGSCALVTSQHTAKQGDAQPNITIQGIGQVHAQPDLATLNLSITHTAPTTQMARGVVGSAVQSILAELQRLGVEKEYIETKSLNYRTEHDYYNDKRILIGIRASQSLSIRVTDIDTQPERLSTILDRVSSIEHVELDGVYFDIRNKEELYKQSRELAYKKARDKAEQYARLSGKRLGAVLSLHESRNYDVGQSYKVSHSDSAEFIREDSMSFSVPTGEQGVSTELTISFALH